MQWLGCAHDLNQSEIWPFWVVEKGWGNQYVVIQRLMQNLQLNEQTIPSKHEVQTEVRYKLLVRLHKY